MIALVWLLACGSPAPSSADVAASPADVAAPSSAPPAPVEPLGLGRPATADEIAAWDIDADPSGHGLPDGHGTVADGKALYAQKCVACHGASGEGGYGPQLVGREPTTGFADDPKLPRTIGNYWPYATTVYDYVHRAMPQNAPGTLTPDETYALAAFLLNANGAVPDDFVADRTSLPAVKMPTKVQFVQDDRETTTSFR